MALVRPAGMSDQHLDEWLTIAAQTVDCYPADILADACLEARKSCRHHSDIVPAIVEQCEQALERRRKALAPRLAHTALPAPPPPPACPPDLDFINSAGPLSRQLREVGLKAGFLIERDDGTVDLAPEEGGA